MISPAFWKPMERMPLFQAWEILGKDFKGLLTQIRTHENIKERIDATNKAFQNAKKIARKLMGKHHPDQGGDGHKFLEVQKAIESIEYHTEQLMANFKHRPLKVKTPKKNKIRIRVDL